MKALLFAIALALPMAAAATAAMGPQQESLAQPQSRTTAPPPLSGFKMKFKVKFVLRRPARNEAPLIRLDDAAPQIVPPALASLGAGRVLGSVRQNPNATICYSWGCENQR